MTYRTIVTPAQLEEMVDAGNVRIFDCSFDLADTARGRALHAAEHLPGARYLDLDADLSGPPTGRNGRHPLPDREFLAARLRRAGLNARDQVVAYDNAGGAYAARLWWLLRWLGHQDVAVLEGGLPAWNADGRATEKTESEAIENGDFTAAAGDDAAIVDAETVMSNLKTRDLLVVDARAAQRFRGEVLVMDAVAGHIPGARNRPFQDNLDPSGRFKTPDALAREFAAVLGGYSPRQVVLQCGSGVTACHNALAMEIAGLVGARLYPGSWSEWAADPARPVAVGAT